MSDYPLVYEENNEANTKFLNVVVEIEDSPFLFGLVTTYTKIRYGDPDLFYGVGGYVYGGLRPLNNVKPYLDIASNLKLSQKIEPEMGKGSASNLSLQFVDVDGFMTKFISPGQILNEPLGGKQVKVWLGYANSSYPEDYFVVYRGYITATKWQPTKVIMELTDANIKSKQQSCFLQKTQIRSLNYSFTPGDVDVTFDTISISGNEFVQGYLVEFSGAPPAPLATGTPYYVVGVVPPKFQVSSTLNGPPINLLSAGSGTMGVSLVDVGTFATTIPLVDTSGFSLPILGPNGGFDPSVGTFIQVDNESMSYVNPSQVFPQSIQIARGARGTTPANHAVGSDAPNVVEFTGNIIDLSLKLMLSGWDGPWKSNVPLRGFGVTDDPLIGILQHGIILPDGVNAVEDLGEAIGDYIYVTGSASNDGTYTVAGFIDARGYPNNVIIVDQFVTPESPTTGVAALRSQYDTFPVNCGTMLRPTDVDVARWQNIKQNFAFQVDNTFRIFVTEPISAKDFIEAEFMKPGGLYLITRFGRISVSATKPPLAGTTLVILSKDNVINPQNMLVSRSTTTRRFFNNIQYFYDTDDGGNQTSVTAEIGSDSITNTTINSVLPINANGLRTALGADGFIARRGGYILRRYQNAAIEITLQCNWKAGSLIQVSDTVALYDNGGLQIANLATGELDIGNQLYEVINWDLDIKSGTASLTLLQQLGYQVSDRFAGIAPSSIIDIGATTTRLPLLVSYGGLYPNQEFKKYTPIIGNFIAVHSPDFSFYEEVTLIGFDVINPNTAIVTPLSSPPPAGYIFELAVYPNTTNPKDQEQSKLLFCFTDPTLIVTSGTSTTVFDVSPSDAAKIPANATVRIHNQDYSNDSAEVQVASVIGTTVTLSTAISFIPSPGEFVELVGFLDGGGAYRIL